MDGVARILHQKPRRGRRGSVSSMVSQSTRGITRESGRNRWQALIESFLSALRDIADRVPADDEIETARRYLQELDDKTRTDHLRSINDVATAVPTELQQQARALSSAEKFIYVAAAGEFDKVKAVVEKDWNMVHQVDRDGNTGLHAAAAMNHVSVVKYLLGKGANPNSQNYNGYTALHWAIENNAVDVAKLLLVDVPTLLRASQSDQHRARKLAAGDISELRHSSAPGAPGSLLKSAPAAPGGFGIAGTESGAGGITGTGRSGRPTGGARLMAAGAIDRPSTRPVPPGVAPPRERSVGLGVPRGRGGRSVLPTSSTAPAGALGPSSSSAGAAAAGGSSSSGESPEGTLTGSQMQLLGAESSASSESEDASMVDMAGRVVVDPAVRNSEGSTALRMVSFLKEKHQGVMRELFRQHRLLMDPDFAAAEDERLAAQRTQQAKQSKRLAPPLGQSKRPSVY